MWRAAAKLALARALAFPRSPSFSSVAASAAADGELRVFVVAGEVSGDSIASRLVASIRRLSPVPVRFSGVGGQILPDPAMHDNQTSAREKVIRLLLPPKIGLGDLVANGSRSCLSSCCPIDIAASTILYSAKKS